MTAAASTFPGATAISAVSIYNWPARDGAAGGTPHLHTASTEAYIVQEGTGRLETLDARGFTSTDLAPGVVQAVVNTRSRRQRLPRSIGTPMETGKRAGWFPA